MAFVTRIYLDHAATAPMRSAAREAMLPWLGGAHNPSSLHAEGRAARHALDEARACFAHFLHARPREIVFTASGSEAIALTLLGYADAQPHPGRLLTSPVEHAAVLQAAALLARLGWDVVRLPIDANGCVSVADLDRELSRGAQHAQMVSLMLVNNETGALQPIEEFAAVAHAHGALLHTDAIAAGTSVDAPLLARGADAVSLAAHKFGGPLGVGIACLREGWNVAALIPGGAQELNRRAGTESLGAIVGAAAAFTENQAEVSANAARLADLRNGFETVIMTALTDAVVTAGSVSRSSAISHLSFGNVDTEALLASLDLAGVAVSAGSACASGTAGHSHVAEALGLRARGVLRCSWGPENTAEETHRVVQAVIAAVERCRAS